MLNTVFANQAGHAHEHFVFAIFPIQQSAGGHNALFVIQNAAHHASSSGAYAIFGAALTTIGNPATTNSLLLQLRLIKAKFLRHLLFQDAQGHATKAYAAPSRHLARTMLANHISANGLMSNASLQRKLRNKAGGVEASTGTKNLMLRQTAFLPD